MNTLILFALAAAPTLRIETTSRGDAFTFKATDSGGMQSNVAVVTVAPSVTEPKSGVLVATDVDGDALIYSIVSQGKKGLATITNESTGEFTYEPWESVTLTKIGGDDTIYTLQRSVDLLTWIDFAVFPPGVESIIDRKIAPQQFYRLTQPILQAQQDVATFVQTSKTQPNPIEDLRQAIKLLEQELPEATYPQMSPLARRAEKKQLEMMEIQTKLVAIEFIQRTIQILEAEKQKVRVAPTLPTP